MSMGGIGSSESTTEQKTQNIDASQTVSDQGVAYRANRSGNQRNVGNQIDRRTFKVAKGGALNITNTYTTDSGATELRSEFDAWRREVNTALAAKPEVVQSTPQYVDSQISDALADRGAEQIATGPDTAKADKQVLWIFGGLVLLLALGALMLGGRKK